MSLISNFETAILVPLVGPKCAASLASLNFATDNCATLLVSKFLGYAIIVNAAIQKLPQLLKIYNAGNAAGVSLAGYLLETSAFAISLAYNYRSGNPISTYGELAFLALSDVLICTLIMLYSRKTSALLLFLLTITAAGAVLSHPTLVPTSTLAVLQASTIGLGISSKVPQIYRNFKAGGTGQLSRATVFMQFGGSAARLFTLLQEVKDTLLIVSCGISVSLNLVNVSQMIYYNAGKAPKQAKVWRSGTFGFPVL
ncbi:hypothetical protein HK097_008475 [Rhizophlyctis rosea]|uniref:Mannose-P-dolichol utilization defect 1 protein homolog n=1 Tax=Rhizophlyctis rosea TaxID=64517 RepID=A0AAD5SL93_9FUNG|nr:hypothetical protein HK097_008475 [Rhizophlyctis rosea]